MAKGTGRNNSRLSEINRRMLTPLVRKRSGKLRMTQLLPFEIWRKCRRAEFLPDGTPFKVSKSMSVRETQGTFVPGLNRPLIIVSDLLNITERQEVATHELREWTRHSDSESTAGHPASHLRARKMENPSIQKELDIMTHWHRQVLQKFYKNELTPTDYLKLTRRDYLKWRKSKETIEKFGAPRKYGKR